MTEEKGVVLLPTLPADTIIDSKERGEWIKVKENVWMEQNYHCVDCAEEVHESGAERTAYGSVSILDKAQDYFGEFEIKAAPLGFQPTYIREL